MNEIREKKIVEMRKQGMTYQEIGEKFGITRQRASAIGSAVLGNKRIRNKNVDIDKIVFEGIYQLFLQDRSMTYARFARIANGSKTINSKQTQQFFHILTGKRNTLLSLRTIDNILKYIGKPYEEVFAPRKRSDA